MPSSRRAKYGSLAVSGYDAGTADGINERGLVANVLYLAESDYGTPKNGQPTISIMAWAQYVLDNYASVAETVDALKAKPSGVIAPKLPNGKGAQLHLAVSDPTGDSAIFEYIGGKLVIHHDRKYQVMSNSPSFDQQLAIDTYWTGVNPLAFLPGSISAADRFVRTSFLIKAIQDRAGMAHIRKGFAGRPDIETSDRMRLGAEKNAVATFAGEAAQRRYHRCPDRKSI